MPSVSDLRVPWRCFTVHCSNQYQLPAFTHLSHAPWVDISACYCRLLLQPVEMQLVQSAACDSIQVSALGWELGPDLHPQTARSLWTAKGCRPRSRHLEHRRACLVKFSPRLWLCCSVGAHRVLIMQLGHAAAVWPALQRMLSWADAVQLELGRAVTFFAVSQVLIFNQHSLGTC